MTSEYVLLYRDRNLFNTKILLKKIAQDYKMEMKILAK